jgi:hypothetical protein
MIANLPTPCFLQLKCVHLVPAKAPLPDEVIFKRNQAAAEKRRAACKAQHKEQEITKCDRNDNHIKQRKAGECDVSSDEDPSSKPVWSDDEPNAAVDWSDMSGSSTPSPPRAVEVTSSRRPKLVAREKGVGSSSRLTVCPIREDQWVTRSHMVPGGPGTSEVRRDPPRRDDPPRRPLEHEPPPSL